MAEKMIKVDHVGENGPVNIYRGQSLAAHIRDRSLQAQLQHFQEHEETHREIFKRHLVARGIRPCFSYHIGGAAGFGLGLITGLIGRKAVFATTVAVEHVVLDHLEHQMTYLKEVDLDAYNCVSEIVKDEREHHDAAENEIDETALPNRVMIAIVKFSTECVIRFGMR